MDEGGLRDRSRSSDACPSPARAASSTRTSSPSLNKALAAGRAKNKRISRGPATALRRAQSEVLVDSARLFNEEEEKEVQRAALLGDWHIPFERLQFFDVLGQGTFKVVHKGTYLDTEVAIAEIMGVENLEFSAIENELNIMQHIRHPNTLLFIGVSYTEDRFFIVTEFAPLGTLEQLIKQKGAALSWKCKLRMAKEIAHALAYLHERGVYHRDLKSENVLVFPGDNDGYLLKLADFGLGFLMDEFNDFLGPTLTDSQVGTVWIRAPEVDQEGVAYDASAVDVFSLGMVFVDILTDGGGEDIRWEVATQKTDPETGKALLAFGLDSEKLRQLLSRRARPAGLVALATECCAEDPTQRPVLESINKRLGTLYQRSERDEAVRCHLRNQLQRREVAALLAAAAIKSEAGMTLWARLTGQMSRKKVPAEEAWQGCREVFESWGPPLTAAEVDVLAECSGYDGIEGDMTSAVFAGIWERLDPVAELLKDPQIGYLWRSGSCMLFCDRNGAINALKKHEPNCLVLRISTTFPGKLTVSTLSKSSGKAVHQIASMLDGPPGSGLILGKGSDSRTFAGFHDLLLYYARNNYPNMIGRKGTGRQVEGLVASMPRPDPTKANDGYGGYGYGLSSALNEDDGDDPTDV